MTRDMKELRERDERQERIRAEREKREEKLELREARLMTTLKAAQPVVPDFNKLNLPKMKDKDNPEVFIRYLEAALVRAKIPPDDWKDHKSR